MWQPRVSGTSEVRSMEDDMRMSSIPGGNEKDDLDVAVRSDPELPELDESPPRDLGSP